MIMYSTAFFLTSGSQGGYIHGYGIMFQQQHSLFSQAMALCLLLINLKGSSKFIDKKENLDVRSTYNTEHISTEENNI